MWGLLTPLLMAILIIWLMARWVRLDEYAFSVRERLAERFAKRRAPERTEPVVSVEDLALRERYKGRREQVLALTVAEARRRVEAALASGFQWRYAAAEEREYAYANLLAPSLRSFLADWEAIEDRYGGVRIVRGELALYTWPDIASISFALEREPGEGMTVQLGVDRDGEPLVVRRGEERVTVVHNGRPGSREVWFSEYPSLFHFLLLRHEEGAAPAPDDDAMERARRMIEGMS